MSAWRSAVGSLLFVLLVVATTEAHQLTVGSFNVESGGADIKTVAKHVTAQKDVDLWGFSEVKSKADAEVLREAVEQGTGDQAKVIVGTTGGEDRLAIVLNTKRLTYVKHFELGKLMFETCGDKHARAPLLVEFEIQGNDRRMWFMVNHLQRGDNKYRHCQAEMLNEWVKINTVRMIAVGDYNFDWSVANDGETHDKGFDLIREGNRFKWIQPEPPIVRTHCGEHNSVLDFVFVTGWAREWPAKSRILKKEESYCVNSPKKESDHRPVWAQFDAN